MASAEGKDRAAAKSETPHLPPFVSSQPHTAAVPNTRLAGGTKPIMADRLAGYVATARELLKNVEGITTAPWKKVCDERGVAVYRREADSCVNSVRGETVMFGVSMEAILFAARDPGARLSYDPLAISVREVESSLVENVDGLGQLHLSVVHSKFKSGSSLVSNRDFVALVCTAAGTDRSVIVWKSIIHPAVPEEVGFVRGELAASALVVNRLSDGFRVNYVAQVNPKGWIPTWLVNAVSTSHPLTLADMHAYAKTLNM